MPFRPEHIVIHEDSETAFDAWERLSKQGSQPAQAIWKSFQTAIARLRADGQWGEVIPRMSIPEHFAASYGVSNLYCVDLAAYHRCFYTLVNRNVVILEIVDHPTYDRWFPGRRR